MKKLVCFLCIAVLLASSGCKDITGTYKPGSFGKTPRETAMVAAVTEKYGDLTQKGDPRFLEARMTSSLDDFIPVDTVSKYSKDAEKLIAWFVYDNFNKDEVEIEWVYVDDDYSIHTFKETTGDDFGRGAFILEQPDDGWALGNYKVIIRGRGLEEVLTFGIHDGPTIAIPLTYENGEFALSPAPGWYFTGWEYIISPIDTSLVGGRRGSVLATSGSIFDYSEGTGGKNDFTVEIWRTYENGDLIARGKASTKWVDPPEYFGPDDRPKIEIDRTVESTWGLVGLHVYFDSADLGPGGVTASCVSFFDSNGKNYVQECHEPLQLQKAVKGSLGSEKAIIFSMNGYGFKYYYEWKE